VLTLIRVALWQCQTLEENMQEYYNIASVPYQIVPINGIPTPILDRRGFLHMIVFDVRSDPNGTHQVGVYEFCIAPV
jgi:hypothetical protein